MSRNHHNLTGILKMSFLLNVLYQLTMALTFQNFISHFKHEFHITHYLCILYYIHVYCIYISHGIFHVHVILQRVSRLHCRLRRLRYAICSLSHIAYRIYIAYYISHMHLILHIDFILHVTYDPMT